MKLTAALKAAEEVIGNNSLKQAETTDFAEMADIRNSRKYFETYLYIMTKDSKLVLFKLNQAQAKLLDTIKREYEAGKPIRIVVLKARQLGFSTLTEAMLFYRSVMQENTNGLIIAHTDEATTNLFNMSKRFYDELPLDLKPMIKTSNAKELIFENPTKDPPRKSANRG